MSGISLNNYPSALVKFFENCPRAKAPSGNFQKISLGLGVIIEEIPSKSRISVNNCPLPYSLPSGSSAQSLRRGGQPEFDGLDGLYGPSKGSINFFHFKIY